MRHLDAADIKDHTDIVAVIGQTVKLRKSGQQYVGFCPFHDNRRTPALVVWPEAGLWKCYGVCNMGGDVIAFVMKRDQCDFVTALRILADDTFSPCPPTAPTHSPKPRPAPAPPSSIWQARAFEFIDECQHLLFTSTGEKALAYLTGPKRGLTVETLTRHRVGFNPIARWEDPTRWGLSGDKKVYLPRGVVLPAIIEGQVWRVKFRLATAPKYLQVRREHPIGVLYNAEAARHRRVVLFTEGEFDCLLLEQGAHDLAGVVTLGAQGDELDVGLWGRYLLDAELILAMYDVDADQTGRSKSEGGLLKLLAKSRRIRCVEVPTLKPGDKDVTDYWRSGGNLFNWLAEGRQQALSQLFSDPATHEMHLLARLDDKNLPHILRADYWADVQAMRAAQNVSEVD